MQIFEIGHCGIEYEDVLDVFTSELEPLGMKYLFFDTRSEVEVVCQLDRGDWERFMESDTDELLRAAAADCMLDFSSVLNGNLTLCCASVGGHLVTKEDMRSGGQLTLTSDVLLCELSRMNVMLAL